MNETEFLALINRCSSEGLYILGFIFDNSGRMLFGLDSRRPSSHLYFSLANHYDSATKCIKDECVDGRGNPYIVYKPIATIQTVMTTAPGVPYDQYDSWSLSQ